jgi:hypothetical protein
MSASATATRMAPSPSQTIERAPEVLISPKAVRSSEAESQVPRGFRIAHLEEVALRYKTDPKFKKVMDDLPDWVWSDKIGLESSGPHRTDDNGKSIKTTDGEWKALDSKDRSWHYPGKGRVALGGDYGDWGRDGGLVVGANRSSGGAARVAYVALEVGAPKSGTSIADLKSIAREAGESLAKLEQTTMPEVLEPIRRLIRATSEIKE